MAIDPTHDDGSRSRARGGRALARAPFPSGTELSRLSTRAREELNGRRLADESSRTVASCPACGSTVRGRDDYVRHRGAVYHAGCALYRPSARKHD